MLFCYCFIYPPPLDRYSLLIRHLPAAGIFITTRKSHEVTRQPPPALVVIAGISSRGKPRGQSVKLLIFTRADRPDSCKMYSHLPTVAEIFHNSSGFHTSVMSDSHSHPLKGPKLLLYKRAAACQTPNCQHHRGFGARQRHRLEWQGAKRLKSDSLLSKVGVWEDALFSIEMHERFPEEGLTGNVVLVNLPRSLLAFHPTDLSSAERTGVFGKPVGAGEQSVQDSA